MASKATASSSESNKKSKGAPKMSTKAAAKLASKSSTSMPKITSKTLPTTVKNKAATKENSKALPKSAAPAQPASSEDEDEDDMAEGASSGGAATSMPKVEEMTAAAPMTPKNFRNHPDMENFFRFIYENDLRIEALEIIDQIIIERHNKKLAKKPATHA